MNKATKPIIPIFFAADNEYTPFLCVSIASLKEKASKEYNYQIYILNTGICNEYQMILNQYNDVDFHIHYVDVTKKLDVISERLHTRDYYSKTTYYRLFIADLFPEYDKAIYLDSDICVVDDISKFYNIEIGDNWVGAISDNAVNVTYEFVEYVDKVVGVPVPNYFNAGILILNLKKFREIKFLDLFADLLGKVKFTVAQDQDYLNALCVGHVHFISKKWNRMPIPDPDFDESELGLIHYNLTLKPWHYSNILYSKYFWEAASKTPFYEHIQNILNTYSKEEIAKDQEIEKHLRKLALDESKMTDTYYTMFVKKKK